MNVYGLHLSILATINCAHDTNKYDFYYKKTTFLE